MMNVSEDEPCMSVFASSLPSGIVVVDTKGFIISANVAVLRLFGFRKDELLGSPVTTLIPDGIEEQRKSISIETSSSKFTSGITRTGMAVTLHITVSFIPSLGDGVAPLLSMLIDLLVDQTFSVTFGEDRIILSVEGNSRETCGLTKEALVGSHVSLLCPGYSENDALVSVLCPMFTSGHFRQQWVRTKMRHTNGTNVVVAFGVEKVFDCPPLFRASFREVESTCEAMVMVDGAEVITSVSAGCVAMFGYDLGEIIGMSVKKICPLARWEVGKHSFGCEHKNGSHFFVSIVIECCNVDGAEYYRGLIRRIQSLKDDRKRSLILYEDTMKGVLEWYDISEKILGTGFFGSVKLATHRLSRVSVAIKTLKKKQYNDCGMDYPPRETQLMTHLRHPNIVRFFHSIVTDDAVYLILEKVSGGDLFDYVSQQERLSEKESRHFMRQIVSAVDFLHRSGVVHRDLKPENILLDAYGNVKIIDLGLGNFFDPLSAEATMTTYCGSPDYSPPEMWQHRQYRGPEVDIWSMGVILFVLVTGFIPFNNSRDVTHIRYVWPSGCNASPDLRDLIGKMFTVASKRCSVEDVISHPWMNAGGALNTIERQDLDLGSAASLNTAVVAQMAQIGMMRADIEKSVFAKQDNQIATTYELLQFQAGIICTQEKSSPDSHHDVQKKCVIF